MNRTPIGRLVTTTLALMAAAGFVASIGCGETDEDIDTATQQLSGEVSSDSEAELDVVAVDESGILYLFESDPEGNVRLELPVGHAYEFYLSEEGLQGIEEANKIVFPRLDGDVDQRVDIQGEMDPFDMGQINAADEYESAEYMLVDPEEASEEGDAEEAEDGEEAEDADDQEDGEAADCDEGEPGLHCVHDGAHPACEGLKTAAENRAEAESNAAEAPGGADEGARIADEAREAAEAELEESGEELPELPEAGEEDGAIDPDLPVALPEFNPPAEFPGCSLE